MREPHDRGRRDIDREIDDEGLPAPLRQKRLEQIDEIVAPHGLLDEAIATLLDKLAILVDRIDHGEARFVEFEMPLDQGQGSASDRAETDHDNGTSDRAMHGPIRHFFLRNMAAVMRIEASPGKIRNSARYIFDGTRSKDERGAEVNPQT